MDNAQNPAESTPPVAPSADSQAPTSNARPAPSSDPKPMSESKRQEKIAAENQKIAAAMQNNLVALEAQAAVQGKLNEAAKSVADKFATLTASQNTITGEIKKQYDSITQNIQSDTFKKIDKFALDSAASALKIKDSIESEEKNRGIIETAQGLIVNSLVESSKHIATITEQIKQQAASASSMYTTGPDGKSVHIESTSVKAAKDSESAAKKISESLAKEVAYRISQGNSVASLVETLKANAEYNREQTDLLKAQADQIAARTEAIQKQSEEESKQAAAMTTSLTEKIKVQKEQAKLNSAVKAALEKEAESATARKKLADELANIDFIALQDRLVQQQVTDDLRRENTKREQEGQLQAKKTQQEALNDLKVKAAAEKRQSDAQKLNHEKQMMLQKEELDRIRIRSQENENLIRQEEQRRRDEDNAKKKAEKEDAVRFSDQLATKKNQARVLQEMEKIETDKKIKALRDRYQAELKARRDAEELEKKKKQAQEEELTAFKKQEETNKAYREAKEVEEGKKRAEETRIRLRALRLQKTQQELSQQGIGGVSGGIESISVLKALNAGIEKVVDVSGKSLEQQKAQVDAIFSSKEESEKIAVAISESIGSENEKLRDELEKLNETTEFKSALEAIQHKEKIKQTEAQLGENKRVLSIIEKGGFERDAYLKQMVDNQVAQTEEQRKASIRNLEKESEAKQMGISPEMLKKLEGFQRNLSLIKNATQSTSGGTSWIKVALMGMAFTIGAWLGTLYARLKMFVSMFKAIPVIGAYVSKFINFVTPWLAKTGSGLSKFMGYAGKVFNILEHFMGGGGFLRYLLKAFKFGFKLIDKIPVIGWIITAIMAIIDIVRVFRELKGGTDGFFKKLMKGIVVALINFLTFGLFDFKKVLGFVNKLFEFIQKVIDANIKPWMDMFKAFSESSVGKWLGLGSSDSSVGNASKDLEAAKDKRGMNSQQPVVANNTTVMTKSSNTTSVTPAPSRYNAEPTLRGTQMAALPGVV